MILNTEIYFFWNVCREVLLLSLRFWDKIPHLMKYVSESKSGFYFLMNLHTYIKIKSWASNSLSQRKRIGLLSVYFKCNTLGMYKFAYGQNRDRIRDRIGTILFRFPVQRRDWKYALSFRNLYSNTNNIEVSKRVSRIVTTYA